MRKVLINRAAPTGPHVPEAITIIIDGDIEKSPDYAWIRDLRDKDMLAASANVFDAEAEKLFIALRDSLPGGTIDRLVGKLLAYKSTHFIVSHER